MWDRRLPLTLRMSSEEGYSLTEQNTGRYVYCIINRPPEKIEFGDIGFGGESVHTVDYKGFAPVVSRAPLRDYGIEGSNMEEESDMEVHNKVVSEVLKEHSVVPVAYGMVFRNKKRLFIAMKAGYRAMKKGMHTVDNRVELGVKVFLPQDAQPDGVGQCQADFLRKLREVSSTLKELNLFSHRLLLNVACLVERESMDAFSDTVEQLSSEHCHFKVQYSGPWAPYNFVDIHVLRAQGGGFR